MSDEDTPIIPAEPFWTSKVFIGLAISAVSQLIVAFPRAGVLLGWTDAHKIHTAVEALCGAAGGIATCYALYKRWRNKTAPLTLTRKAADVHPNTIAYVASTTPPEIPK